MRQEVADKIRAKCRQGGTRLQIKQWTHHTLKENQYLVKGLDLYGLDCGLLGFECIGYTDGVRDKSLDGEYLGEHLKDCYYIICANCERGFNGWERGCPYCWTYEN